MKILNELPEDLKLIPATAVRKGWYFSENRLWTANKTGALPRLRDGKRVFYRLSDLRAFLQRAEQAPPIKVPWKKKSSSIGNASKE